MLAYSSIAHAGFILVGVFAFEQGRRRRGVLFYLVGVRLGTVGAFAVVTLVAGQPAARRRTCRSGPGSASGSRWSPGVRAVPAGLRRHPADAASSAKFAVFAGRGRTGRAGRWPSSACCASAIAAFFYVRVIVLMYFTEPAGDATDGGRPQRLDDASRIAIGVAMTLGPRRHSAARCSTWPARRRCSSRDARSVPPWQSPVPQ